MPSQFLPPSSLVTALLVTAAPAPAQDKTAEIDKIFSWVTPGMPGCAVAASHKGKARKRLFEPLGMKATKYARDMREAGTNVATAYEKRGDQWQQDVMLGNARGGSGGLFTRLSDR